MKLKFGEDSKKISRSDVFHRNKELNTDAGLTSSSPEVKRNLLFEQLRPDLDSVIESFFPEEFKDFVPPNLSRLYSSFLESITYLRADTNALEKSDFSSATLHVNSLIAASIIRYIDNFIDEALWPHLHTYNKDLLEGHFKKFLESALAIAREYEPSMPDEIIRLPKLELDLALNPTQENFDNKFNDFFKYKSFDIRYIHELFVGKSLDQDSYVNSYYELKAIKDVSRDFLPNARDDVDFNLYNHIVDNNLDPDLLITYLDDILHEYSQAEQFMVGLEREEHNILRSIDLMLGKLKPLSEMWRK